MIKHVNSISSIHFQNRDYLFLHLTPYGKSKKKSKNVLFNLDTKKVEEITPDVESFLEERREAEALFSTATNVGYINERTNEEFYDSFAYHLTHTYNLDTNHIYNSYALSSTNFKNKDQIPKNVEQVNFSRLYPDIAKKLTVKNIQIVGREGMVDQEIWFNTLLHWFAPQGEERLELYALRYDFSTKPPTELYKPPVSSYADIKACLEAHPEGE